MFNCQRIRKEPQQQEKSLGNNLQSVSSASDNISSSIVDAMRIVRLISAVGLKPWTFKPWADRTISYLSAIPGKNLHIIFDNYVYEFSVPTKRKCQSTGKIYQQFRSWSPTHKGMEWVSDESRK